MGFPRLPPCEIPTPNILNSCRDHNPGGVHLDRKHSAPIYPDTATPSGPAPTVRVIRFTQPYVRSPTLSSRGAGVVYLGCRLVCWPKQNLRKNSDLLIPSLEHSLNARATMYIQRPINFSGVIKSLRPSRSSHRHVPSATICRQPRHLEKSSGSPPTTLGPARHRWLDGGSAYA